MKIKVTSTISKKIVENALFRGFWIAFIGVSLLLIGGVFLNLAFLQEIGFLLFLASISCITIGLLPYRKYTQMQLNPAILIRNEDSIEYYLKEKKILTIPIKALRQWSYINDPLQYGILLSSQMNGEAPILVHQKISIVARMQEEGRRRGGTLFFPFFNLKAYEELFEESAEYESE